MSPLPYRHSMHKPCGRNTFNLILFLVVLNNEAAKKSP